MKSESPNAGVEVNVGCWVSFNRNKQITLAVKGQNISLPWNSTLGPLDIMGMFAGLLSAVL